MLPALVPSRQVALFFVHQHLHYLHHRTFIFRALPPDQWIRIINIYGSLTNKFPSTPRQHIPFSFSSTFNSQTNYTFSSIPTKTLSNLFAFKILSQPSVACDWKKMRSSSFEKMLDCFSLSICANTCLCSYLEEEEEGEDGFERKTLVENDEMKKLKEFFDGKSLAFHLEPKTIVLKVSMHCQGCARKVKKHIAKIEGVTSFEVDLENKKVVVIGDISPFDVLQSVSKIKFTELLMVN